MKSKRNQIYINLKKVLAKGLKLDNNVIVKELKLLHSGPSRDIDDALALTMYPRLDLNDKVVYLLPRRDSE